MALLYRGGTLYLTAEAYVLSASLMEVIVEE